MTQSLKSQWSPVCGCAAANSVRQGLTVRGPGQCCSQPHTNRDRKAVKSQVLIFVLFLWVRLQCDRLGYRAQDGGCAHSSYATSPKAANILFLQLPPLCFLAAKDLLWCLITFFEVSFKRWIWSEAVIFIFKGLLLCKPHFIHLLWP